MRFAPKHSAEETVLGEVARDMTRRRAAYHEKREATRRATAARQEAEKSSSGGSLAEDKADTNGGE
jgi:hypothetical protein